MPDIFWLLLKAFLLYRTFKFLSTLARPILSYWIYPKLGWVVDLEPYKKLWTVVTGGTDGIGKAYVTELANRGFTKFILIGRNNNKLKNIAQFLYSKYRAEVNIFKFDFNELHYEPLVDFLKETQNIGILVNSVGLGSEKLVKFGDLPEGTGESMLRVNSLSVLKTCEVILPKMVMRDQGIIVNIASIQGWRPTPLLSTYSASKAFVSFLSECLHREYGGKSIRIQCLVPILVATKMSQYDPKDADGIQVVTPEVYAKQAVDIIGNCPISSGCISHEIQCAILAFFPYFMLKLILIPMYSYQQRRMENLNKENK